MHASIACLLLDEDDAWVSLGNAMQAKHSKAQQSTAKQQKPLTSIGSAAEAAVALPVGRRRALYCPGPVYRRLIRGCCDDLKSRNSRGCLDSESCALHSNTLTGPYISCRHSSNTPAGSIELKLEARPGAVSLDKTVSNESLK
jgi:hypothetical protein